MVSVEGRLIRRPSQSSSIDSVVVHRVSLPVDPPMISGTHHVASVDVNIVEIIAGEDRGIGYTFAFSAQEADAVTPLVLHLAKALRGAQAADVRAHWSRMWAQINFMGRAGAAVMALSAIDTALWDLHARQLGAPLHMLLGLPRCELPVYFAAGWLSFSREGLVQDACEAIAAGYRGYKMRLGGDWQEDVRRVMAVREAIGPEPWLMADANQAWDLSTAIQAVHALEPASLRWLEEPVDAEDFEGLAAVRAEASMPIAAGETVYGTAPFARMIATGSADVLQPDLMRCGGITGFFDVATLARIARLEISTHLFTEVSAHLMAIAPAGVVEYLKGWFDDLFEGAPDSARGLVAPTERPGLGITLRADTLERWGTSRSEL